MVKRYHASFPSLSYEFDSRYPLHDFPLPQSSAPSPKSATLQWLKSGTGKTG